MSGLVPVYNWQDPKMRKLRATRAAHEGDKSTLLELTIAFVYLKSKKKANISPRTIEVYLLGVRDFLDWAWPPEAHGPLVPLLSATGEDLDRWIISLQLEGGHLNSEAHPLRPSSIAAYLAGVRQLFAALAWAKARSSLEPVYAPPDPIPAGERRPALPLRLYRQLVEHLAGTSAEEIRNRVIVRLMGDAGLRIGEVTSLQLEQVLLEDALIIVIGKGGKQRTIPLSNSLIADLWAWIRLRTAYAAPAVQALFVNMGGRRSHGQAMSSAHIRRLLRGYYQTLSFPKRYYGAHILRHTAGTRLYQTGRDLYLTARMLGHANVNTSSIYAKMDMEGLRKAVERSQSVLDNSED